MSPRTSVAIAGAGLGGLCLAQSLLRAGFDVHVYERDESAHIRRQGYRITTDEHGIDALRRSLPPHLFELYLATASDPSGAGYFRFLDVRMRSVFTLTFEGAPGTDLRTPRQADRQTLRALLLSGLGERVHFGKAAERVDVNADGATLYFTDGTAATADLVVGADGANSPLRQQLLPECTPTAAGLTAIYGRSRLIQDGRSLVPEALANSGVLSMGAPGSSFFFTTMKFPEPPRQAFARLAPDREAPVDDDYVMWAINLPTNDFPADRRLDSTELHDLARRAAREFHPVLRQLVDRADIDHTLAVPMRASVRPRRWAATRATLLGDAVHLMPPFNAHGGNTALRDAALLGEKLRTAAELGEPIDNAVAAYQEEMLDYAFKEVEDALKMMSRATTRNPIVRWGMLHAAPWVNTLRGKSPRLETV
ncbi:FAD-dependent oxidoreductase [Nocardia sp. NPDC050406]|uniref:FAD-dependent oxidoreductase n=1 Tax=Nocardia sp. NPDC050406 TaxID=3364318 RepID=UPI00378FCA96